MKIINNRLLIFLLTMLGMASVKAQLTPQEAILQMQKGINIGNTLDAPPGETSWGNPLIQEYYFDDIKAAGFNCVRLPVTWEQHIPTTSPYAVNAEWMARVEQIVDWALSRNLFVILNAHHDGWIKGSYTDNNIARFDSLWSQIATRFKGKSDKLLFEILNEPEKLSLANLNQLNSRILGIIRKNNPTRIVVYSGTNYTSCDDLLAAKVPTNGTVDNYLIANFHSYGPWDFVSGNNYPIWGTQKEKDAVKAEFDKVANFFKSKNIPVMVNEFGCPVGRDYNSRMAHYAAYVENAISHGMAFCDWDDNGSFKVYNRQLPADHTLNGLWDDDVVDIITRGSVLSPGNLKIKSIDTTSVQLSWQNRASNCDSIYIERKTSTEKFTRIGVCNADSSSFIDSNLVIGNTYYYRVIAHYNDSAELYSYPVRLKIKDPNIVRKTYGDNAVVIPGIVEAENFDIGDEGLTYHDLTAANAGNSYRLNEGVDIEARTEGGYQVGYMESGEWLEYTINVTEAGNYKITAQVASMDGGGTFTLKFANGTTKSIKAPKTSSWQTTAEVSADFSLLAGEQIMRLNVIATPSFNIDKLNFTISPLSVNAKANDLNVKIFPNPAIDRISIITDKSTVVSEIQITDISGKLIKTVKENTNIISVNDLSKGYYLIRIISQKGIVCKAFTKQ